MFAKCYLIIRSCPRVGSAGKRCWATGSQNVFCSDASQQLINTKGAACEIRPEFSVEPLKHMNIIHVKKQQSLHYVKSVLCVVLQWYLLSIAVISTQVDKHYWLLLNKTTAHYVEQQMAVSSWCYCLLYFWSSLWIQNEFYKLLL